MNARNGPEESQAWIHRARALTPLLDAAGPRIDAAKSLPADVLDALVDARLYKMLLPRSVGGAELELTTFFEVMLALAEGDASAAWTVSQSNGCALSAAYMSADAALEVFGGERDFMAWGFPAGRCQAIRVDGGWRVTGHWGFGSGSRHASWLGGHCQVVDPNGNPVLHAPGVPMMRTAIFSSAAVTRTDTRWDVLGLRGTGSDSYAVNDYFVPERLCIVGHANGRDLQRGEGVALEDEPERRENGPLYHFSPTTVFQTGFAAVALGIARAMLNSFVILAREKTPAAQPGLLRDNAAVQERVALARARLDSPTAWIRQTLEQSWQSCLHDGHPAFADRVSMRLASTFAIREATRVVDEVYADAGTTAIFADNPFERRLRDIKSAAQQIQGNSIHLQTVGQYYLGLKPSTRFL